MDFPQKPQKGPAPLLHGSPPEIHRVGVLLESFLQILAHLSFSSELPHLPDLVLPLMCPPSVLPGIPPLPPERQGFAAEAIYNSILPPLLHHPVCVADPVPHRAFSQDFQDQAIPGQETEAEETSRSPNGFT